MHFKRKREKERRWEFYRRQRKTGMRWFFPRTIQSLPDHARLAELPTDLRSRAGAQRAIIPRMLACLLRESNEPPHCLYASNWFAARLTECKFMLHTITEMHAAFGVHAESRFEALPVRNRFYRQRAKNIIAPITNETL